MKLQSRLVIAAGKRTARETFESGGPAVASVQRLRFSRADQRLWPHIAHLFPEFSAGSFGPPAQLLGDGERATGFGFAPGFLKGPPFTTAARWVSGQVIAGINPPGWVTELLQNYVLPNSVRPNSVRPDAAITGRASALAEQLVRRQIGGQFWAPKLPDGPQKIILRAPTPREVRSLVEGLLLAHAAEQLLLLAEHLPRSTRAWLAGVGVAVVGARVDPWSVLPRATALHVAGDDELATLGILAGRPVHCHTPGAASGWGLTADEHPQTERRSVPEFAAAVLLQGARYGDPRIGRAIECETALDLLAEWREVTRQNQNVGCCVGVSFWKRSRLAAFFHDGERAPPFRRRAGAALAVAAGRTVAGWNSRIPPGLEDRLAAKGRQLIRVEDGFIRSRGLGSGFLPPASIIADAHGIYYDPRQPSDLELILSETQFDPALCDRARALMAQINRRGITKYAAGEGDFDLGAPPGRRRILVPGQVADDLSVLQGGGRIRDNLALLEYVRAANPGGWVVYKPHPDVEAGHRAGALADADLRQYADQVVRNVPMSAVIASVDEVHTMTSLAGFEALLRGLAVTVLGQPFYAGWGLTTDLSPLPRRTRRLRLEELVAGVLILYPRYLDPLSGLPCGPELLLDRLEQPELWRASWLMKLRNIHGKMKLRLQTR